MTWEFLSRNLKLTLIEFRYKSFNVTHNVTESTQFGATSVSHTSEGCGLEIRKAGKRIKLVSCSFSQTTESD